MRGWGRTLKKDLLLFYTYLILHVSLTFMLSYICLSATPWVVAYPASPSMGFSRQEYWSGLSFPSPGYLPDPGIKPGSPAL